MSGRKGYEFEDKIVDLFDGYFKLEKNIELEGFEVGQRFEFDIIASRIIPPLGKIHFLIECKTPKVGMGVVVKYWEKVQNARKGRDERATGKPVIVSEEGFTSGAVDRAKELGITLLSEEDILNFELPLPAPVERYLDTLFYLAQALVEREEYLAGYQLVNVSQNSKSPMLKRKVDLILEFYKEEGTLLKKKSMILLYIIFVGRVNVDTFSEVIEQYENAIEQDLKTITMMNIF